MQREISCRITHALVMYVREANRGTLDGLLEGLPVDEAYLCDVHNWISHDLLQTLYQRMIAILGDPDAVYKMTLASERFRSLGFLDHLVRLLGTPRLIYIQAPKYNRLFKLNGDVILRETGPSWVVLEDRYHDREQKTRHDCDYTRGILSGIPTVFGLPAAYVEELSCQVRQEKYGPRRWPDNPAYGAEGCLYRVHFSARAKPPWWHRLFGQPSAYRQAIEDLLEANRTIQEKYGQVMQLAEDLDVANKQLLESKRQLEASTAELRVSEQRYRLLAENISDAIWVFDLQRMRFEYFSPSIIALRGYTAEEAIAQSLEEQVMPESLEQIMKIMEKELTADGKPGIDPNRSRALEILQPCKDGTFIWIEAQMRFIRDRQGQPIKVLGVSRDIRERKAAQAALNAEKERLAVTLRSIGDGVITTDRNGSVALINPVAQRLTGWSEKEALGQPLSSVLRIVAPQDRRPLTSPVTAIIENGNIAEFSNDTLLIGKNGQEALIAQTVAPILDAASRIIGVVVVFADVTEIRDIASEIQKIEKLESLGILAGGIAHDFNNFLSGIIGNLSLAKLELKTNDRAFGRMQEMEKAALRAKKLTQQLLTFSRGGDPIKRTTELNAVIREAAGFASRGSNVRCDFLFPAGPLYADVDEGQIVQVIHNLVLNAMQAMPEGGTIHLAGDAVRLPENNDLTLATGAYAKLTIQDQGVGIKKEHIQNIFDPYFTTKQKGSGLGLAVVYAIIDKHNGRITVDSRLGEGTTFDIYLPAASAVEIRPAEIESPPSKGSGRILVMDDEPFIRELAQDMLNLIGYEVATVKNGEEALQAYKEAQAEGLGFDAVILDLTVPGAMGGKEAVKQLREMDPHVRAIVSSGYSNDPIMANYAAYGFQSAVRKPYRIQDISEALKAVLNP
jgi:PAS domain S-box-containing protein